MTPRATMKSRGAFAFLQGLRVEEFPLAFASHQHVRDVVAGVLDSGVADAWE